LFEGFKDFLQGQVSVCPPEPGLSSLLRFASSGPLYTIFSNPGPTLFKPGYPREPQGFGEWLRRLRLNHGLLIKDFARLVGVSEDTVSTGRCGAGSPLSSQGKN